MKSEKKPQTGIIHEMLKDLIPVNKGSDHVPSKPTIGQILLKPADLMQDAGEGYNADFVDPQQ